MCRVIIHSETMSSFKLQLDSTPLSKIQKTDAPLRWEHAFAADFSPNWHLAYTMDEQARAAQRLVWLDQLRCGGGNYKIFDLLVRSAISSSLGVPTKLVKSEPVKTVNEVKVEVKGSGEAFVILNGSVPVEITDRDRPFVIGKTTAVNDLGENILCPDLNLKHLTNCSLGRRHCGIVWKEEKWWICSYAKIGVKLLMTNGTSKLVCKEAALKNGDKVVLGNDVWIDFYM